MQQQQQAMVTPAGYDHPQPQATSQQLQAAAGGGAGAAQPPPGGEQEYGQDQAAFEADKRSVYKHPLFPLLALLFERCEQATQSAEHLNSESFNMDIQAFVQHQERDRKPFLLNDPEVDGLMIKAIQVLRIHLLELEKVQELCKDFCNRYITCLKGKMQSENLLRSDYAYNDNNNLPGSANNNNNGSSSVSSGPSPPPPSLHHYQQHFQHQSMNMGHLSGHHNHHQQQQSTSSAAAQLAAYQMAQQHQVLSQPGSPPPLHQGAPLMSGSSSSSSVPTSPGIVHGSTPLSQIGVSNTCPPSESSLIQNSLSPAPTTPGSLDEDDDGCFGGMGGGGKKPKRGVLPKHATSVMRSWLFQHLVHPYPTEDEKRQIAAQTNLTLLQVNNWFINARRRILQPMLDASNPGDSTGGGAANPGGGGKSKKSKSGGGSGAKQAAQRFWPDSIASLQPQLINGATLQPSESSMISSTTVLSSDDEESDEDESDDDDEMSSGDEAAKPTPPPPHQ